MASSDILSVDTLSDDTLSETIPIIAVSDTTAERKSQLVDWRHRTLLHFANADHNGLFVDS